MKKEKPEKTRLLTLLERLERRAKRNKLSVRQWLANADIEESSYYRWKSGQNSPRMATIDRLEEAANGDGK